jgi:hypothetical protein
MQALRIEKRWLLITGMLKRRSSTENHPHQDLIYLLRVLTAVSNSYKEIGSRGFKGVIERELSPTESSNHI